MRRIGKNTIIFDNPPKIEATGTVVGSREGGGPLGDEFDICSADAFFGQPTWEEAEAEMQKTALSRALENGGLAAGDLQCIFGGDLENQCTASGYGLKDFGVPFAGLYGACSTMAEGLALAAVFAESGAAARAAAVTSSHICTAERQFRYPLEYGGQRPSTAQWTVTGAGATLVAAANCCPKPLPTIGAVSFGIITELGVKDIANMGAAMAPAAAATVSGFLNDTATTPADYDLILTGDLGEHGLALTKILLTDDGWLPAGRLADCGMLIYDNPKKEYGCGGSGCGCSAAVLNSYIYRRLCAGELKKVLFVGTGALMSPVSVYQGQVIPAIAHAVQINGV